MSRMWSLPHKFDEAFEALSATDKAAAFETLKTSVSICIRKRVRNLNNDVSFELIPPYENFSISMHHNMMDDAYEFFDGDGNEVFTGAPKMIVDDMTAPLAGQAGFTPPYVPLVATGSTLADAPAIVSSFTQAELDEAMALAVKIGDVSYTLAGSPDLADALAYTFAGSRSDDHTTFNMDDEVVILVEVDPAAMKSKALYWTLIEALAIEVPAWSPRLRALYGEAQKRLSPQLILTAYEEAQRRKS